MALSVERFSAFSVWEYLFLGQMQRWAHIFNINIIYLRTSNKLKSLKGALTGAISGLLVVSWIGFGAQVATASGQMRYPVKPTSIHGCSCTLAAVQPLASPHDIPE